MSDEITLPRSPADLDLHPEVSRAMYRVVTALAIVVAGYIVVRLIVNALAKSNANDDRIASALAETFSTVDIPPVAPASEGLTEMLR